MLAGLSLVATGCQPSCSSLCEDTNDDPDCNTGQGLSCGEICAIYEDTAEEAACGAELNSWLDCLANYKNNICEPSYQRCDVMSRRLGDCYSEHCRDAPDSENCARLSTLGGGQ